MKDTKLDKMMPVDKALGIVLRSVEPVGSEFVELRQAANRILSKELAARRTQPPFNASAMDGYAVKAADLGSLPEKLEIIGQSRAGVPFAGDLARGQAVRIFTGAVVPKGADTIIIQENTSVDGISVLVQSSSPPGKFIRKAGLDFSAGEILIPAGTRLNPRHLALAASMGHSRLKVFNKPKVALIATGDELVLPGEQISDGKIIASNSFGIAMLVEQAGGEVIDFGIAPDQPKELKNLINKAIREGADLIVTMGGASVGDHDIVLPVAQNIGFEFEIAKILMRPGKPFLFAKKHYRKRDVRLVGLAGNPVSSMIAGDVFVRPLVQKLSGVSADALEPIAALLGRDLPKNNDRQEFMRAQLDRRPNGTLVATPFDRQDSSMLANLVRAECLLIRPVGAKASKTGDSCSILLLT